MQPSLPMRAAAPQPSVKPTISEKFFETLANVGGFYGRPVEIELDMETASLESWDEAQRSGAGGTGYTG